MKRSTFSILFFIRRNSNRKNGESPIFVRITLNGNRADISLKRTIDAKLWDKQKGKCKGNSRKAKDNNYYMECVRARLLEIRSDLELRNKLTIVNLKNIFLGKDKKNLLKIFQEHNDKMEELIGIDCVKGTVERFRTTYRYTKEFIKVQHKTDDISLNEINHLFITDMERFIKTTKNCSHNTTIKHLKNLRKVILIAIKNNWINHDPYSDIKFKKEKVNRDYLTNDELKRLMLKDLHKIERLEKIKDAFIFCCFTGLSFSDVKSLSMQDLVQGDDGKLWIKKARQKTKIEFEVPISSIPFQILKRYENSVESNLGGKLLPIPSNQKYNAYLKEIAILCEIDKKINTHTARHTFASTVTLGNNLNIKAISKMMGHTTIKMTEHYAKPSESLISNEMNKLEEIYKAS